MKKRSKLLVIGLVIALTAMFSVSVASAATMWGATVSVVKTTASGDAYVRGEKSWGGITFTILSSSSNYNQLLAAALTAYSSGGTVDIEYTGSNVDSIAVMP